MKKWQKLLIKATALGVLVGASYWFANAKLPSWTVTPVVFLTTMGLGFLFMKWS